MLAESFRSILGYFQVSKQAQQQANDSVQGPQSPVGRAQHTRQLTVELLKDKGDAFRRSAEAHRKSLHDIQRLVNSLSLSRINQKASTVVGTEVARERPKGRQGGLRGKNSGPTSLSADPGICLLSHHSAYASVGDVGLTGLILDCCFTSDLRYFRRRGL